MSAPPGTPTRSDAAPADLALCRSAVWEALALGFRPPAEETVARLASPEGADGLAAIAAVLDAAAGSGLEPLTRALAVATSVEALRVAYGRLFGHTARGEAPPYETEYGEASLFEPQRELADLGAFFRAFGLRLDPGARERPDHVACECEFLLVLARKEAHARRIGDEAMLAATDRAARLFLRDHPGRWAPGFGTKLGRLDPDGFYGALGRLLAAFVAAECRRVDVAAGPEFLRLRPAAPDATPMACGPLGAAAEP